MKFDDTVNGLAIFIEVLFIGWVLILVFVVMIEAFNFQNEPVDVLDDCELSWSSCSARDCSDPVIPFRHVRKSSQN